MDITQPSISIIVPVYNIEKYLARCLDSIENQTVKDFECIMVNDGSTDSSGTICEQYSQKDNRFILINIENGGPSKARNIGLEHVKSQWVTFVDSDDYIKPNYLQTFLTHITDITTQVIQGYHCMGYEGEDINTLYKGTTYPPKTISQHSSPSYFNNNNILHNWAVWCKIFSMEIIKKYNLRFNEYIKVGEDGLFWHQYLCHIQNLIFVAEREYTYFCPRNFNSISRISNKYNWSFPQWITLAEEYKKISKILPKKFPISKKNSDWVKMYYLNNYFKALILPKSLTEFDINRLKKIKPSKYIIVWNLRGFFYYFLNLFPIRFIRKFKINELSFIRHI